MKRKGTVKLLLGVAVITMLLGIFQLTAQDNFGGQDQRRNDMRSRMGGNRGGQMGGMMRQQPTPVMIQDEKYLYVCAHEQVFKIDKTTFKVVATVSLPKPQRPERDQGQQRRSTWGRDTKDK